MRPENQRMQKWLADRGVTATPKRFLTGSMRGTWRLYDPAQKWTEELRQKLVSLGFLNFDGSEIPTFAGNGGTFCVFVRGHDELA